VGGSGNIRSNTKEKENYIALRKVVFIKYFPRQPTVQGKYFYFGVTHSASSGQALKVTATKPSKRLSFARGALIPHRIRCGIDFSSGHWLAFAVGIAGSAFAVFVGYSWRWSALVAANHFAVAVGHFIRAAGQECYAA
jgi:hypothetical protein